MPVLLTSADNQTIRQAIRADFDDVVLPDDMIAQDTFAGAAVREVLRLDPLSNTRTSDAAMRLKLAAVYFTAARLCGALAIPTSESFGNYRYTLPDFDPSERQGVLYWLGLAEVAAATGQSIGDLIGTVSFGTPAGRRGDIGLSLTVPLADRTRGSGGSSILGPF